MYLLYVNHYAMKCYKKPYFAVTNRLLSKQLLLLFHIFNVRMALSFTLCHLDKFLKVTMRDDNKVNERYYGAVARHPCPLGE